MTFIKILQIGEYVICRDRNMSRFYVYIYDRETKKTFSRSLFTDDLEVAIAAVRSLVERTETRTMDRPR